MRIIGGRDFYDSARAFGEDRENVFVRHKQDYPTKIELPCDDKFLPDFYNADYIPMTVIFAGKVYHGVEKRFGSKSQYFWRKEALLQNLEENKTTFNRVFNTRRGVKERANDIFAINNASTKLMDILIKNKIVIGIHVCYGTDSLYNEEQWYINTDGLKNINFQKVLDPWQAYQELSMFVDGVLPRNGNQMVEITDNKMKIEKAGFDNKSSFRHPIK